MNPNGNCSARGGSWERPCIVGESFSGNDRPDVPVVVSLSSFCRRAQLAFRRLLVVVVPVCGCLQRLRLCSGEVVTICSGYGFIFSEVVAICSGYGPAEVKLSLFAVVTALLR